MKKDLSLTLMLLGGFVFTCSIVYPVIEVIINTMIDSLLK
jgi:hypothetical protein